jgi:hypothetical protein
MQDIRTGRVGLGHRTLPGGQPALLKLCTGFTEPAQMGTLSMCAAVCGLLEARQAEGLC